MRRNLRDLGQMDEAELLLQRAVTSAESQLGPSHPDTLRTVHTLGSSERLEAELLFRRALKGHEAQLGAQHQWTLDSINGLAKLLEAKASFAEACAAGRRCAKTCEFRLQCCIENMFGT